MNWNWRAIRAIMRKDLKQVTHNTMVWLPIALVPLIMMVILPLILVMLPTFVPPDELSNDDLSMLFDMLPPNLSQPLLGLSPEQQWVTLSANYMFAPMFLIVPLMVASVLGGDSFVGEKERRTLEGLLYTPLTDAELFVAKLLAALMPALVVTLVCFLLYGVSVNVGGYRTMGGIFFPASTWWPLVFWLAPGVSVAGLGIIVLVSSKAKTFMAAQQTASLLVLPIMFLMVGQVSGLFFLSVGLLLGVGALVWLIGFWLIWIGSKTFSRGELIARL